MLKSTKEERQADLCALWLLLVLLMVLVLCLLEEHLANYLGLNKTTVILDRYPPGTFRTVLFDVDPVTKKLIFLNT